VQPVAEIVEKGTSYLNIMLGSLAILLLAIGGFFSWRKRQAEPEDELQNIFKATDSTVLAASSEATKEDEVVVLATPVEASFDTKTTEHIKVKEEVMDDVLLDADTYLAYGKYDEAEKSLRQELKVSPYKDSYKLKLLEVFYSSENNEAFDDFI
jgi:pilus assembly protein FimV